MSIKRIFLPLPGSVDNAAQMDMALTAAKALDAHVEALFISEPPPPARTTRATQIYAERLAVARPLDLYAEERERRTREERDRFASTCASAAVPLLAATEVPSELVSASWREMEGSYETIALERAASFDLIVAAAEAVVALLKDIAEKSLLQTRRPVLLAPSRRQTELTGTAMVAWDESPECWHALSASIPFLKLASSVQIVSVDRRADSRGASQAEALTYLRCHGIVASARIVAPHLRSIGDTLLAEAEELRAGLLVMGAYSHSRLREMLLGGATHHVLKNAASRPVLMAH